MTNDVRQHRDANGLSQGRLAQALQVSRQTINSIETGRYIPSLPLAITIARFFGLTVEEIFHADEKEEPPSVAGPRLSPHGDQGRRSIPGQVSLESSARRDPSQSLALDPVTVLLVAKLEGIAPSCGN